VVGTVKGFTTYELYVTQNCERHNSSTDSDSRKDPRFGKGDSTGSLDEGTLLVRSRNKAILNMLQIAVNDHFHHRAQSPFLYVVI